MDNPIPTYGPEWFKARRTHLGASEIGALMGLSPFQTAAGVWDSKHNDRHIRPDASVNTRLWWGHRDEPGIVAAASHDLFDPDVWITKSWAWMKDKFMVSPDAVITDRFVLPEEMIGANCTVLEAKSVGTSSADDWINGPPLHVMAQVYGQIALLGAQDGYVAARIAGDPVRTWHVPFNGEIIEAIHAIIEAFWTHTEQPAEWEEFIFDILHPTGWVSTKPVPNPREIELEEAQVLLDWMMAQRAKRNAEKLVEDMRERVSDLFGDNDVLTFMGSPLAESHTYRRANFDRTQLALDHPDIHDMYVRTSEYTVYKKTPNLENLR